MKWIFLFFIGLFQSQHLQILNREQDSISFRGLSVVDENTFWVTGSKGIIGKTEDGGNHFEWENVKKFAQNEFRDIHAFNRKSAFIMAITQPAAIIKSSNGGKTFKSFYEDDNEKAFLDAMDCIDERQCLAIGDAVKPRELYILRYEGKKWKKQHNTFHLKDGEVFFAASGSNIQLFDNDDFMAVSGGVVSRFIYRFQGKEGIIDLEMIQGKESTGANAMYYNLEENKGIIVGGDFMQKENSMFNLLLFSFDETTKNFEFTLPKIPPKGYKSSICQLDEDLWVCCGTSGIDYSTNGGNTWEHFNDEAFYVIQRKNQRSAFLAGPNGKIALLLFN